MVIRFTYVPKNILDILQVTVEAEGRRFKSRGPLVFLRTFLLRNAPAGNHQLVAEDLMEDGTVSRISNAY
jgi:hypothetical protein